MRLRTGWLGRRIAPSMVIVLAVMAFGAGISQARGINATKYYEDTLGNLCVGVEEVGGFPQSCAWGAQKGKENAGAGYKVLEDNTTGNDDAAFGYGSLLENESGSNNTGDGYESCFHDTTGSNNTCVGYLAQLRIKTGGDNTATGSSALFHNTSGSENVGVGYGALYELLEGNNNVALGTDAGSLLTTTSNNVDIANEGVAGDSGTIRIGTKSTQTRAFMAGIYETTIQEPGCYVLVNAAGQLGCKAANIEAKVSGGESPALVPQSAQEGSTIEHQQSEINQLASELRSLRQEIAEQR
jgi:hypothetical protein